MQINFQGQYNKDLFFKGVALANQPPRNSNRLLSFLLVMAVGSVGVIGYRIIMSGDLLGNAVYLAAAIFMGGFAAQILLRPYFVARKLWADSGVQRPLKGVINEQGITYQLPAGDNLIPWSHLTRVRKNKQLTTLVRKDGLLVIFAPHFFKGTRYWEQFNKLVDRKIIPTDHAVRK